MSILGSKCAACGSTESLTFDCRTPQGDTHHRWEASQRMSFYRSQYRRSNLQILCQSCNATKGSTQSHIWEQCVTIARQSAHQQALNPLTTEQNITASGSPGRGPVLSSATLRSAIKTALAKAIHNEAESSAIPF